MRFPCGGFYTHSGISGGGKRCGNAHCGYCNDPFKYATTDFPSITCPKCAMVSYNTNDIKHRYCGNCHEWHEFMNGEAEKRAKEALDKINEIIKKQPKYCEYPACMIQYVFEHWHHDEFTITFRKPHDEKVDD